MDSSDELHTAANNERRQQRAPEKTDFENGRNRHAKLGVNKCQSWCHAAGGVSCGPDIGRSRGLRIPETTTSTCMSGRFVRYVLVGPVRNRTTDTRIFKDWLYRNLIAIQPEINLIWDVYLA